MGSIPISAIVFFFSFIFWKRAFLYYALQFIGNQENKTIKTAIGYKHKADASSTDWDAGFSKSKYQYELIQLMIT